MVIVATVAAATSLYVANSYIASIRDDSAKATVAAGEITVFGVIFSALYKEISAFYSERAANIGKKWDLIFPLLKKHYYPWLNSAKDLQGILKWVMEDPTHDQALNYFLYLELVFYGYRMRFIDQDGGLLLLGSLGDQRAVEQAYRKLELALDWAGKDTPRRVVHLQKIFQDKDKPGKRYLYSDFEADLVTDKELSNDTATMKKVFTKAYLDKSKAALDSFVSTFEGSIERLYTAWSEA